MKLTNKTQINEMIKLLKHKGLSHGKVAERLGVSKAYVSKVIRGVEA